MNIKNVKVTATRATDWSRAKVMALQTSGKKIVNLPDEEWKRKLIVCEHSPIRMVEYDITIEGIPQWVTTHLVRHHIGVEKFVSTQRTDRNKNIKCERDDLPQGELNTMTFVANAQALINISRVRLCRQASPETRAVWEKVREAIREIDPLLARAMQPNCIYRGRCPEIQCCGWNKSTDYLVRMAEHAQLFEPLKSLATDEIVYEGVSYPCRTVNIKFGDEEKPELIATETLQQTLLLDSASEATSNNLSIDERVFFYVPDDILRYYTDEELKKYIEKNL